MSAMKRFAEQWSGVMGFGGEITDSVLAHAQRALDLERQHCREPLTIEQIREQAKANVDPNASPDDPGGTMLSSPPGVIGHVEGIVAITLGELTRWDIEGLDDALSMRLTGTELLTDICYSLIGVDLVNDKLYFRVEGDSEMILESAGDSP